MKIAGLKVSIERTAYPAYTLLCLVPMVVRGAYVVLFQRSELRSIGTLPVLGLCIAGYHACGQFVHQLGHAFAARAVGHPMTGIRYEYGFSFSEYPPDEPSLPAAVHIQRSLGGFSGSVLLLATALALWLRVGRVAHGFKRWALGFVLFDALLLFIGSVLSDVMYVVQQGWIEPQPNDETPRP